ncbi:MAG: hypothetical protein ACREFX_03820 [Opitutaceae bacterium]
MIPRLLLVLAAVFALGAKRPTRPEVEFVRVWPQWHRTDEFKRISEYFTNRENPGDAVIRRSQPIDRTGFYFIARVRHPRVSLLHARFVLRIITPESPDARVFTFPAGVGPGEQLFELGLTGSDWAGEEEHPVAWRLDLLAADGHELAWHQSFLWSKPDSAVR